MSSIGEPLVVPSAFRTVPRLFRALRLFSSRIALRAASSSRRRKERNRSHLINPLCYPDATRGGPGGPPHPARYGVQRMDGLTRPVQSNVAMLSQPLPEPLMSAGSQPLPGTAYHVGSQ